MTDLEINHNIFENIKHIDGFGNEYWEARELQLVLDYKEWRKFENVIEKACENSNVNINDHFVKGAKMINLGKAGKRSGEKRV